MPVRPTAYRPPFLPPPGSDASRRPAYGRGYDKRWARASRAYRARYPLCVGCMAVGRVRAADLVDHIVPVKGNPALMWDEANWQSSCRWHHDVVKQLLEREHAKGELSVDDLRLDSERAQAISKKN